MLSSRQFLKYRFFIVILAMLAVTFCFIALLINQSKLFSSPNQFSTQASDYAAPTMVQTAILLQNEQTPPTQTFPHEPTPVPTSIVLEWTALPPLPENNRGLITNGDQSQQKVALTFDLCQREGDLAGYDNDIIRILNESQTPATFFLGGLWMQDHQAETLELARNPLFELGNHSWSHLDFSVITSEQMDQEIKRTQQKMFEIVGYQTNLFRLPYGTYNDTSLNVIGENGLYTIQWDVVSGDPDPNIDAHSMAEWVLQQVNHGSIIIMHANGRGWHTAEALPAIIQTLHQEGYTLVTVSELLKIQQ